MSNEFTLTAVTRQDVGKGASRRLRRLEDKVPAVVYGAEQDAVSLELEHRFVIKALENEAFYSHILALSVDGKKEKVVLKALQRHPSKARILHMDFLRVSAKEKLTMQVPLHVLGEEVAPGVKLEGGNVSRLMTSVEVSCLPGDLPEFLEIDISELKMGESIHLSDIRLPKGVEFVTDIAESDQAVISINKPRAAVEEEAEGEAVEATAEEKPDA